MLHKSSAPEEDLGQKYHLNVSHSFRFTWVTAAVDADTPIYQLYRGNKPSALVPSRYHNPVSLPSTTSSTASSRFTLTLLGRPTNRLVPKQPRLRLYTLGGTPHQFEIAPRPDAAVVVDSAADLGRKGMD